MPTSRRTAQRLCNAAEYRLVEESFPPLIGELDTGAIRSRIARTRRLRDKYRGQAQRRAREIRGKAKQRRKVPARSNELSQAKEKLFDETLARFDQRLNGVERARGTPAAAKKRGGQAALAKKALAQKRAAEAKRPTPPGVPTAGTGMRPKPAGGRKGFFPAEGAKKGALSAAVRRGQARRDARR